MGLSCGFIPTSWHQLCVGGLLWFREAQGLVVALGPIRWNFAWSSVCVARRATGLGNPFILDLLPGFSLMNHLAGPFLLASVPLIVLVARGAQNKFLLPWSWICSFCRLVSPILPSAQSSASPSVELAELPEGDVVILPAGLNIHPQKPLWEQRFHGKGLVVTQSIGLATCSDGHS